MIKQVLKRGINYINPDNIRNKEYFLPPPGLGHGRFTTWNSRFRFASFVIVVEVIFILFGFVLYIGLKGLIK